MVNLHNIYPPIFRNDESNITNTNNIYQHVGKQL